MATPFAAPGAFTFAPGVDAPRALDLSLDEVIKLSKKQSKTTLAGKAKAGKACGCCCSAARR